MSKVILDPELKSRLNGLNERLELCTKDGKTLGWYLPEAEYLRLLYAEAKTRHTDAEIEELERQEGDCTLQEIWKQLGQK